MKHFAYIAALALVLVSCKGGNESANESANEQQPSAALFSKDYNSADLAMQELKGNVKSMEYYSYECDEQGNNAEAEAPGYEHMKLYFFFDENGTMTNGYAYNTEVPGPKLVRNAAGQITHYEEYFKEVDFTFVDKFTYNSNGNIAFDEVHGYEAESKTTFKYDDKGELVSSSSTQEGEGSMLVIESTYKVLKADDKGNWTRRLMKSISKENDGGKMSPNTESYAVEAREIVYY